MKTDVNDMVFFTYHHTTNLLTLLLSLGAILFRIIVYF